MWFAQHHQYLISSRYLSTGEWSNFSFFFPFQPWDHQPSVWGWKRNKLSRFFNFKVFRRIAMKFPVKSVSGAEKVCSLLGYEKWRARRPWSDVIKAGMSLPLTTKFVISFISSSESHSSCSFPFLWRIYCSHLHNFFCVLMFLITSLHHQSA